MRAHYLQHVPFEGLGSIAPWLAGAGYEVTSTPFYESAGLPAPAEVDLLVVLGGPMSVNDEGEHPWLRAEKAFVRACVEAGTPVLGVCLGAQLIANAMGARVYRNREKEIGWFPVRAVPPASADGTFRFPASAEVFHWHGETFDLPAGAVLLASSVACANQAFQLGRSVIGLQFHLETTPASARELVSNCRNELVTSASVRTASAQSAFVQSEAEILGVPREKYETINRLMAEVLAFIVSGR